MDVYKINEGEDLIEFFDVLLRLKNEKLNIKNEIFETYGVMVEEFEQNHFSRAAKSYRIRHDSIRIMKWMAHYDSIMKI